MDITARFLMVHMNFTYLQTVYLQTPTFGVGSGHRKLLFWIGWKSSHFHPFKKSFTIWQSSFSFLVYFAAASSGRMIIRALKFYNKMQHTLEIQKNCKIFKLSLYRGINNSNYRVYTKYLTSFKLIPCWLYEFLSP